MCHLVTPHALIKEPGEDGVGVRITFASRKASLGGGSMAGHNLLNQSSKIPTLF